MKDKTFSNHLSGETSPYLLQHAHNPVNWHPWSEEALEKARREDKPILLSIGYSACHWCHVMAHESFEDETTAEQMNRLYVNIKVDREERPDLDKIYQLSHQLLSRRPGGWPLTIFLDPHDQAPFFTGTYFPKESRYNLPGFTTVLEKVSEYYHKNKEALAQANASLIKAINSLDAGASPSSLPGSELLEQARRNMERNFDSVHGGFGSAPKFPHPTSLDFLLRQYFRVGDAVALHMAEFTLQKMAEGGIYDQIGGGFCRYSVDAEWNIPHFEKMLYDNGPLLALYSQAWQVTGKDLFKRTALETAEWTIREMQSPTGGYYSSLDADSEGEEGRFYVWNRQDTKSLLTVEESLLLGLHYGLENTPNFEGHWHLHVALSLDQCAAQLGLDGERADRLLLSGRGKLFAAREQRVRPGLDDKILTAWNALMIKGMAIAGRILRRDDFLDSSIRALDFLHREAFREGRLYASWKDGKARFPAYLDDYTFLIDAALELLQCRFDNAVLDWTIVLADELLARFEDRENGGFFFTAHDHEMLLHRPKSMMDEALPSGNGVAALVLNRLGHMLGETRYMEASERALRAAAQGMHDYPNAFGTLLNALEDFLSPPQTIVLRGNRSDLSPWRDAAMNRYAPNHLCLTIPSDAPALPGLLAERKSEGEVVAYVCEGSTCRPPIRSLEAFRRYIEGGGA